MKKVLSVALVCVLMLGVVFTLASCSNISESYADKINEAAESKKYITYDEVMEALGEDADDKTFAVAGSHSGVITASDDNGTITITIVDNAATKATYTPAEEDKD